MRLRSEYMRSQLQIALGIENPKILRDFQENYASSILADQTGQPVQRVQHHLAHAFATVLEHRLSCDFVAAVWDGFGLGDDGNLWGGEFFQRRGSKVMHVGSLRPFPVFGGEGMAVDTCLSALSLLSEACPGQEIEWISRLNIPLSLEDAHLHLQRRHVKTLILQTSSAGRLIDGICCLLGLAFSNSYDGQAGIMINDRGAETDQLLAFEIGALDTGIEVDWRPLVQELLQLRVRGVSIDEIAGRFWNSLAAIICGVAQARGAQAVVLGGGCFQGRELLRRTDLALTDVGINVFWPERVPAGDSGISLGQLAASNFMEAQSGCV